MGGGGVGGLIICNARGLLAMIPYLANCLFKNNKAVVASRRSPGIVVVNLGSRDHILLTWGGP